MTPGPEVRTDLVDVYLFRRAAGATELLQLRRVAPDAGADALHQTWQPVMGHVEPGESAVEAAVRELGEETGLDARSPECLGLWALEQIHPFYLASRDAVMLTPRFACEVGPAWTPRLNHEHDAFRWVPVEQDTEHFMWPGQHNSIDELRRFVLADPGAADRLRIRL